VQAQLRELAEQNRALLEHQKLIDREIQQQQAQLAQQAAAQAQLNAQAQVPGAQGQAGGQAAAARTPGAQGPLPAGGTVASNSALPDATSAASSAATPGAMSSLATFAQNVKLWGYGELYYTDPVHDRNRAQADLARAVFGIGYSFDSRTEFNSEYEVEHRRGFLQRSRRVRSRASSTSTARSTMR